MSRLGRVRDSRDQGSALAIALTFLMVFGALIGVVLQFATTGQRITLTVRDEATSTYGGGGALDGAINTIRGTSTGVDPGTSTPPVQGPPCFTMPGGQLGATGDIAVTCQPRQGSGGDPPAALLMQPAQAILARSTHGSEGVSLAPSTTLTAQGRVRVNSRLTVPGPATAATLRSTGPNMTVQAGNCTFATGTVAPPPGCVTTAVPVGDPGWAAPTTYPAMGQTVPACGFQARVVSLSPGTYLSGVALQDRLTNCAGDVIWFQPGTYYFDFRDATTAARELDVPNGTVVVGGTPLGWVPNTTLPANVPAPSAAQPTTSACAVNQPGVEFVFAGDSRLNVLPGGDVQLCAKETSAAAQHVVLRGLANQSAPLPAAAPTAGDANTSVQLAGSAAGWTDRDEGADVDDNFAYAVAPRNGTTRTLRVGPFPTGLVPPEATNVAVTVSLRGGMLGPSGGATNARITDGTTTLANMALRTCPAAGCNDTALSTAPPYIQTTGVTPAIVNSMYIDVYVTSPNVANPYGGTTTGAVDGITVSVDFSAPMRATSGTGIGAPYVSASGATTPILRTAGGAGTTVVALHGTVDAQAAAVDLGVTAVPYTVIDRGVAVRHLQSSMTPAAGYTGPLISVPDLMQSPRRVLMVARDTNLVVLVRADVSFGNVAGPTATTNGPVPTITEWSVN